MPSGDFGVRGTQRQAARPRTDGTRPTQIADGVTATSLPQILDGSPRMTSWKYPTAITTTTPNSVGPAAAERVGAIDTRMVSPKRTRVRCRLPPAIDASSYGRSRNSSLTGSAPTVG